MKTAVVILNWNGKALLKQFLPSVVKYSTEASVYVADNASTDDSVAFVQSTYPQVHIVQNTQNGGYAKGYNDALQNLTEDIFILLNSDVEVTEGWLTPLLNEFRTNKRSAALQPKLLDFRRRDHFEYAGAAGGFVDMLGYPYCRGRIFDHIEKDMGQYDVPLKIFWASGACLAIRREAFYEAGKFDEDFFAHQEEIDLCWRLFNLGREVKSIPNSVVYHLGGATLDNMHPRKTFFNFRNSLFALVKNAPGKKVWALVFTRLLLDGAAGIKFLIEGKSSHTLAIIKAHFSFYSHLRKFLEKRRKLPKKKKYYNKNAVVVSYYLQGKKTFLEL